MQHLVDTYKCEWKEVVNDPEKRRFFKQFANTDETEPTIEFVKQREQQRPADWTTHFIPVNELGIRAAAEAARPTRPPPAPVEPDRRWVEVGKAWDFPRDGGATDQVRQDANRRVQLRQPRRVVRHARTCARTGASSCCRAA